MVSVKKVENQKELETVYAIRQEVFVVEQKVPKEEEFDAFEEESAHYIAYLDGHAVGAARWRTKGKAFKLERFAVLKDARQKGVGFALVQKVIHDIEAQHGPHQPMLLHAQLSAVPLYEKAGFAKEGDIFMECDIAHYLMKRGEWT